MAKKLKVTRLGFRAGSSVGAAQLSVDVPSVTLLVGPNNAGKSRALREIEARCAGVQAPAPLVIREVDLELPDTATEALEMLEVFQTYPGAKNPISPGNVWLSRPARDQEQQLSFEINEENFRHHYTAGNRQQINAAFVRWFMLRLDGRTRFFLVDPKPTGPLERKPENHFWQLFVDDEERERVRKFTEEAFGRHFVIDPTGMTQFRLRLSDRQPDDKAEEQALDERARQFHKEAALITDLGDGVQTSVGLVSAVLSLPDRIILIDEPEAFLHPTLARRVGATLSKITRDRDASLIVATHSAEFLMGCLQTAPDTRIVRLTYTGAAATARTLQPGDVQSLLSDPLLRSANALRAIFHRGVVVCEADADRAFYDEINSRLSAIGKGAQDTFFMNAQNWQTAIRVAGPLRKLGVPAAVLLDFDVLMDDQFSVVWNLVHGSPAEVMRLQTDRNSIKQLMTTAGRAVVKSQGVSAFAGADRAAVDLMLGEFSKYGVFFVPVGELEGWLAAMPPARGRSNKARWLVDTFSAMGSDPTTGSYAKPGTDDVWDFVERVRLWIDDPNRSGIPV